MDIQVSSNFERYLFEAAERDAALVRAKHGRAAPVGPVRAVRRLPWAMRAGLSPPAPRRCPRSPSCIRRVKARSGYLLDPHTACGVVARARRKSIRNAPHVVLATAHPAKFPDAMQAITGERPALPPRLASLMTDPERITVLPNDLAAVQRFVEQARNSGRQGAAA